MNNVNNSVQEITSRYCGFYFDATQLLSIFRLGQPNKFNNDSIDSVLIEEKFSKFAKQVLKLEQICQAKEIKIANYFPLGEDKRKISIEALDVTNSFFDVVDEFKKNYVRDYAYTSYIHAILILSCIISIPYFSESIVYDFILFCREKDIFLGQL